MSDGSGARSTSGEADNVTKFDSEYDGQLHDIDDNLTTFSSTLPKEGSSSAKHKLGRTTTEMRKKPRSSPSLSASSSFSSNNSLTKNPVTFKDMSLPIMFLSAINSADLEIMAKFFSAHFAPNCQFVIRHNEGTYTLDSSRMLLKYWFSAMNIAPDAIFTRKGARFPLPRKDKVEFAFDTTVTKIYVANVFEALINSLLEENETYKVTGGDINSSGKISNSSSGSSSNSIGSEGTEIMFDLMDPVFLASIVSSVEVLRCSLTPLENPFVLNFSGTMTMYTDEEQKVILMEMDTQSETNDDETQK